MQPLYKMNEFVALLTEKIPKVKQDNIFTFILAILKKSNITNIEQLKSHLNTDIGFCQKWLDDNKEGSTINDIRREYAKKISHLKDAKELVDDYL